MTVYTDVFGHLSRPLTSLPAVRECASLSMYNLNSPVRLSVAEILKWLKAAAHSKEPKKLEMSYSVLRDSADDLVRDLKTVGVATNEYIFVDDRVFVAPSETSLSRPGATKPRMCFLVS